MREVGIEILHVRRNVPLQAAAVGNGAVEQVSPGGNGRLAISRIGKALIRPEQEEPNSRVAADDVVGCALAAPCRAAPLAVRAIMNPIDRALRRVAIAAVTRGAEGLLEHERGAG